MESNATRWDGATQAIDLAALPERLRKMKPTVSSLIASLLVAVAGIGFSLLILLQEESRTSIPGFIVISLLIGCGHFVRFLDLLSWRYRISRLLRDCKSQQKPVGAKQG